MFLSNKKVIIIYSIIFAVIGAITVSSIFYYNNNIKKESPKKDPIVEVAKKQKENTTESLNINELYTTNGIVLSCVKKEEYSCEEMKITNLKDKEVENKINKQIKGKSITIRFNANNVFSYNYYKDDNSKIIDLNTGDEITFDKIFTESTDIGSLIAKYAYENILFQITNRNEFNQARGRVTKNISWYEDFMLLVKRAYEKGNYSYYLSPNALRVIIKDKALTKRIKEEENKNIKEIGATIYFADNYEKIAIYDRYKSEESLFNDSEYVDNNALSYLVHHSYYFDNTYETSEGNQLYKIDNFYFLRYDKAFAEQYKKILNMDSYKNKNVVVSDTPSKDYIFEDNDHYKFYDININSYSFDSLKDFYKRINSCKSEDEYVDVYIIKDIGTEYKKLNGKYNLNGKKITSYKDLFTSNNTAEKQVKKSLIEKMKKILEEYDNTELDNETMYSDIEKFVNENYSNFNITYGEYDLGYITVKMNENYEYIWKDTFELDLKSFDKNALAIYE